MRHALGCAKTSVFLRKPRFTVNLRVLPNAFPQRALKRRRSIDVQVFSRGGSLWEIDAHIVATKTRHAKLADGVKLVGVHIHGMLFRAVIDQRLNILKCGTQTNWMPCAGLCDQHGHAVLSL